MVSALISNNCSNVLLAAEGLAAGVAGAEGRITVDLDKSVFIQVALSVLLMLAVKPVLFDPMLKLFEEREKRIEGARALARSIDEKSATAQATYEAEMSKARSAANVERDKFRAEGVRAEVEILGPVRAEATLLVEEGRHKAQAEAEVARKALQGEAGELGRVLASRILGREVH